MMEAYLLWRLSMVLVAILAFSIFIAFYKFADKIFHRRKVEGCER